MREEETAIGAYTAVAVVHVYTTTAETTTTATAASSSSSSSPNDTKTTQHNGKEQLRMATPTPSGDESFHENADGVGRVICG